MYIPPWTKVGRWTPPALVTHSASKGVQGYQTCLVSQARSRLWVSLQAGSSEEVAVAAAAQAPTWTAQQQQLQLQPTAYGWDSGSSSNSDHGYATVAPVLPHSASCQKQSCSHHVPQQQLGVLLQPRPCSRDQQQWWLAKWLEGDWALTHPPTANCYAHQGLMALDSTTDHASSPVGWTDISVLFLSLQSPTDIKGIFQNIWRDC